MSKVKKDYGCKLLPFEKTDCVSMLDAQQKAGWGITAFNLPEAWKYAQGEGVVIAVLDTGADLDHPDLKENLIEGINLVNRGTPPQDDNGHGSHVTGILVGVNNDIGMVGVCPKAKVMPVKVLDKRGNGNLFTVAEGIRWAADHGANFIQMSLGSPSKVQNVRKAIQYAESKGVVTFVAAGNAGKTDEIFYPANYKETISVGAIDENFRRADFSCTGRNLDFMAPGVDIFSTVPPKWYATLSGTSMACPFIVGVATLVLSYVKSGKKEVKLTCAEDYREIFRKNTIHVTDENLQDPQFFSGFGIIDPRLLMDDFQG
jgi:subtilisin family serine protease